MNASPLSTCSAVVRRSDILPFSIAIEGDVSPRDHQTAAILPSYEGPVRVHRHGETHIFRTWLVDGERHWQTWPRYRFETREWLTLGELDCLWELAVAYARYTQGGAISDIKPIYHYYAAIAFGNKETLS